MSVSDSPIGRPTLSKSSCQAALPAQKSARVGGRRPLGVAAGTQVAGMGVGQGGGEEGVGVWGGVGVGGGGSETVGLNVTVGLSVGLGVRVIVGLGDDGAGETLWISETLRVWGGV